MGIMPKESRLKSEEEDKNYETAAEGEDGGYEGVWMDGEDDPHDDLRYNGEGKKNSCIAHEHVENTFEAINRNTSKVSSKTRNTTYQ